METEEWVQWDKWVKIEERGRRSRVKDKRERKIFCGAIKFCKKISLKFGEKEMFCKITPINKRKKKLNKSEC